MACTSNWGNWCANPRPFARFVASSWYWPASLWSGWAAVDSQYSSRAAPATATSTATTIFVGHEMFWGNDRFELVRFYVQKSARA